MASSRRTVRGAAVALMLLLAGALLASPAAATSLQRWNSHISEASARFGIPAEWIRRVIQAESGGLTMLAGRPITSHAGAMGLMQLMPGTWGEMRAAHRLGPDPHHPRDNILAGTAYLRVMYDRFGYPGLFAAYNAGPARYADHVARGRRLPGETIAYVAAVTSNSQPPSAARVTDIPHSDIFVAIGRPGARDVTAASRAPLASQIFVRLASASANSN